MSDAAIIAQIFAGEGAVELSWEVATRCTCYSDDTRQPTWDCPLCNGSGVTYAAAVAVRGLFRSQARWNSKRPQGEHGIGDAQLTTPLTVKPGYTDARVRDRFTVSAAAGDVAQGRVFYAQADPVPFLFGIPPKQLAWRVTLQSHQQATRTQPM